MDILIAHPSAVRRPRLQKRLMPLPGVRLLEAAADLTATFNTAEHQVPDLVLIAAGLAKAAEFEVLSSLFAALGITCVLLDDGSLDTGAKSPDWLGKLQIWPEDLSTEDYAIRMRQIPIGKAQKFRQSQQPGTSKAESFSGTFDPLRCVLIGSSTGGVDALLRVLAQFPKDCPPTLIVQHTGGGFTESLVRLLDKSAPAHVESAEHGSFLEPGLILIAPGDKAHLRLGARDGRLRCTLEEMPAISGHRPSVDVLFRSALPVAKQISAAILTGMGRDGAAGLTELRNAGAITFGQDARTSVVYGMPRVAYEMGGIDHQLPIDEIGTELMRSCQKRGRQPENTGKNAMAKSARRA